MESKLPTRKWLNHKTPFPVQSSIFFLTICCQERGRNSLCKVNISDGILSSSKYYHDNIIWHLKIILLMPDHLHAIISINEDRKLSGIISNWKRYLKKCYGIQWQKGFFDHRIRGDEGLDEKCNYILMNPVRQGLVKEYQDWPYKLIPGRDGSPQPSASCTAQD